MINLAVINLKDIGKYFIKIVIALILLWLFSKFILSFNNKQTTSIFSKIDENKLLTCLDETIPGMKQINNKENIEIEVNKVKPLEVILKTQLSMIYNITNKTKEKEQEEPKKVEEVKHAETRTSNRGNRK